jgi:peptidoglycan hydrolase-like protein with peptidoglycan-binding domain
MNRNRMVVLLCGLALVAVIASGGWVAGMRIESPAEVAARTAPPTPSPILVQVEERVLSSNIVTRGTARFGLPQPVAIAPSPLKPNRAGFITTLPTRNTQLREGDVMFTISGRPVLVLQGEVPAYRDLVPGISGHDVRQLEQGLQRLGFDPGPIDGTYDDKTSSAVSKWYKSAGYEPFGPTVEQLANIRTIETAVTEATKVRMQTAGAAAAADLGVEAARTKALQAEKAALAEIEAGIAERELALRDPRKLAASRSAAEAKIEAGRAALKAAKTQGELTVQEALEAKKIAQLDARWAADRLARVTAELSSAQRQLGVQVPIDEIVFIPALPVRVQEVTAAVGNSLNGPVLSVTDNQITIHSSLALDAAPFVKPGMGVHVDEPAYGVKTKGTVEKVESTPGTHGVDGYHIYFAVRVDSTPVPLDGFSLRLTIPIRSTKRAVITVPLSAVFLAADGTSRVQVDNNGTLTYLAVEPGLAANGYVEVTPLDGTLTPGQLVVVGSKNGE